MVSRKVRSKKTNRCFVAPRNRRGAVLLLVAIVLPILLGMAAFAVDVAYMQMTRAELKAATDAAARAGGEALSRLQNTDLARIAAKNCALANSVAGEPLELRDEEIVFGLARMSGGEWEFVADGTPTNAVRVYGKRTNDALSGPVNLFFGKTLGAASFQPRMESTVVRLDRDICLVLDRSSSMKLPLGADDTTYVISTEEYCNPPLPNTRWFALVDAVDEFIAGVNLTPTREQVGLVTYSSDRLLCGIMNVAAIIDRPLNYTYPACVAAIDSYTTGNFNGSTNIEAGIRSGISVLTDPSRSRPFAYKTMILLTDGNYNTGQDPARTALDAKAANIIIHTITFGADANQTKMRQVAEATGGMYFHAPNAEDLRDVFREVGAGQPITFVD